MLESAALLVCGHLPRHAHLLRVEVWRKQPDVLIGWTAAACGGNRSLCLSLLQGIQTPGWSSRVRSTADVKISWLSLPLVPGGPRWPQGRGCCGTGAARSILHRPGLRMTSICSAKYSHLMAAPLGWRSLWSPSSVSWISFSLPGTRGQKIACRADNQRRFSRLSMTQRATTTAQENVEQDTAKMEWTNHVRAARWVPVITLLSTSNVSVGPT